MGLIGLVQLSQRILQQAFEDSAQNGQNPSKSNALATTNHAQKANADAFVASARNSAADAGIFKVQQVSLFSAAANFLLDHNGNSQPAAATANAAPAVNSPTTGSSTALDEAALQSQLSNLNDSLAVSGLSPGEITVVDRVAQLIKDFNPVAFTDLIKQLKSLAQAFLPSTVTPTATTPPNAATSAAAGAGSFTIKEVSIAFSGFNETLQQSRGGKNAQNGVVGASAFQLQVSEVTLTLENPSAGQSAQIQAPQTANATAPFKAESAA